MFQLIETIRLENGGFSNLEYHFNRMKKAWKELYSIDNPPFDLAQMLKKYAVPSQGLFKCRIVYGKDITDIGILPILIRPVNSLKAVYDDTITYDHKYEDRSAIEALFSKRGFCDDIVIVKDGLLTDTSSANIILKFSDKWFTPAYPLLRGDYASIVVGPKSYH